MALVLYSEAMNIKCPTLQCRGMGEDEEHLADNICFQHDGGNPTLRLVGDDCMYHQYKTEETTGKVYCNFDLLSKKFAWVEEMNQHINSIKDYEFEDQDDCPKNPENTYIPCSKTVANSQVTGKRTQAECKEQSSLFKDLNAGRNCTESTQCVTLNCGANDRIEGSDQKICKGRKEKQSCFSSADCHA